MGHRVARVDREVHEDLLDLPRIDADPIEITGHTDGQPWQGGTNRELGALRALSVYDMFLAQGYLDSRMRVVSMGEADPAKAPQNDRTANKWNRRIEITVLQPAADVAMTDTERVAALAENAQYSGGAAGAAAQIPQQRREQVQAGNVTHRRRS